MRHVKHGNPTFLLPSVSAQKKPRLIIAQADNREEKLWQSHLLNDSKDALKVDVWNGFFTGKAKGCSILPPGQYDPFILNGDGHICDLETFDLKASELFTADFTEVKEKWFKVGCQWYEYGKWNISENGITPRSDQAAVFVEGAQHGTLTAKFKTDTIKQNQTFGLVSRVYNSFYHIRLEASCRSQHLELKLVRHFGKNTTEIITRSQMPFDASIENTLSWSFNGQRHMICLNNDPALETFDGYMGGVTVVGLFSQCQGICWTGLSMASTQGVEKYEVIRPSYRASIRPGNIQEMNFIKSSTPEKNIFWESGIQFGHIGGSEIKFTQAADLNCICDGEALTQIQWRGPMPKFYEQSKDVRGQARGLASFYPDRIVLADYVLTHTNRSVGPDFDMAGQMLAGPAKIALAGQNTFKDWTLKPDGDVNYLDLTDCSSTYPLCLIFPLKIDNKPWYLKAVILSLLNADGNAPASIFAWQCPYGLTASHDFRVSPNEIGKEYGFSIVVEWQKYDRIEAVEKDLLDLREDLTNPALIEPLKGGIITYPDNNRDKPADFIEFSGCFDRAKAAYRLTATPDNNIAVEIDTLNIPRRSMAFLIENILPSAKLNYYLKSKKLCSKQDYYEQMVDTNTRLLLLKQMLTEKTLLEIRP